MGEHDAEIIQDSATIRELQTELEPELLRGVSMSECLSGWAQHFVPPDPGMFNVDLQKYQLSRPTESYDEFLSHDWATSRWMKLCSLLIIYNSRAAAIVSLLTTVVIGILQAFRILPGDVWLISFTYISFWITLFFWQRMRAVLLTPATVFLDKLCIAQHDEDLKLKGILGLAGFLDRSKRLTILWSHRYFSRLWCTYELATFLRDMKNPKPIQIMPVKMAVVLFLFAVAEMVIMIGLFWMSHLNFTETNSLELFAWQIFWFWLSMSPFILLVVPVTFYVGMSLFEELQDLPQQLAEFSVQHAQCFCCSNDHKHPQTGQPLPCDRELIFNMLKRWYGKPGDVGTEHLKRFSQQVQEGLSSTVLQSMGRSWIPLSYTIYMVGIAAVPGVSRTMVAWMEGPPVPLEGIGLVAWGLRQFMQWAFIGMVGVFWVQLSMQFLHYGLRWSKYITRTGCALVLWIPVMVGVGLEYTSFLLCFALTDHDSLIPVIPFVLWTLWIVLLSHWSDGPAKVAQSAKSKKEPIFKEDGPKEEDPQVVLKVVPDDLADDLSNTDTVSVFET